MVLHACFEYSKKMPSYLTNFFQSLTFLAGDDVASTGSRKNVQATKNSKYLCITCLGLLPFPTKDHILVLCCCLAQVKALR